MPITTAAELKNALSDINVFQQSIVNFDNFIDVISALPAHADALFTHITSNSIEFKRLVTSFDSFEQLIRLINEHTDLNSEAGQPSPDHITPLISQLIADPELFQRLMKKARHLADLAEIYPEHTSALLDPILTNIENYQALIKNYSDVIRLFHVYSHMAFFESFHMKTAANPAEFQRLITTFDELECFFDAAKKLSDPVAFQENIAVMLTSEDFTEESDEMQKEIRAYIENKQSLINAGLPIPDCTGMIITQLTTNPQLFRRLLDHANNLVRFSNQIGSHYAESLIKHILSDTETYNHFVLSAVHIRTLIFVFPRYAEELLAPVLFDQTYFDQIISTEPSLHWLIIIIKDLASINDLATNQITDAVIRTFNFGMETVRALFNDRKAKDRLFPHYVDFLIDRLKALSLEKYRTVVNTVSPLIEIANTFQKQADIRPCINALLSNPQEFQRLVQTPEHLTALAKLYPNIRILKSGSINDVASNIEEYTKARDNASVLGQAGRCAITLFHQLDPTTLAKIACHTVNQTITDPKVLDAVVNKAFDKPIMPKI